MVCEQGVKLNEKNFLTTVLCAGDESLVCLAFRFMFYLNHTSSLESLQISAVRPGQVR